MIFGKNNLILFIFFITTSLIAQPINFQHLSTEDGLSSNSVNCIFQDSKGYIWIGTSDGLNKYNGTKFSVYKSLPNNPNTISGNYITSITEDADCNIWIGTFKTGLTKFNPSTEQFTRYRHNPKDTNSLPDDLVQFVLKDKKGNIYASSQVTNRKIYRYDKITNKFTFFFNEILVYFENDSILYSPTETGLVKYNMNSKISVYIKTPENNRVSTNLKDRNGDFWENYNSSSVSSYNLKTNSFNRYFFPYVIENIEIKSCCEDEDGNIWFGTRVSGLLKLDALTKKITQYKNNPTDKNGLNSDSPYAVLIDRLGVLWVGTYGNGINIHSKYKSKFNFIKYDPTNKDGFKESFVNSISEDKFGRIWITGSLKFGITIWNRQSDNFKYIPQSSLGLKASPPLFKNDIYGGIWVTTNNSIFLYDDQKDKLNKIIFPFSKNSGSPSLKIQTRSGDFYLSSNKGILKYSKKRNFLKKYDADSIKQLNQYSWLSTFEDKYGVIWLGTQYNGLFSFNPQTEIFSNYKNNPSDSKSISHNHVSCVYEDSKGSLWLGTRGAGLNRLNRDKSTFERFQEGLPNEEIYGILEDKSGNLWLSTNNGLSRFNSETGKLKNYNVSDGLLNNEFNTNGFYKSKSGELFFGSVGGVVYFDPEKMVENNIPPEIIITSVKVFDEVICRDIYNKKINISAQDKNESEIELPYDRNFLTFEFAAIDYNQRFPPEKRMG